MCHGHGLVPHTLIRPPAGCPASCVLRPASRGAALFCGVLRCDNLTALGRSLIAGSCPLLCSQASSLSALRLPKDQKTTSSRRRRPSRQINQQQIALVSIHRAPAASRGFFTPFLYKGPSQQPQLGTAPPQENVAASQHNLRALRRASSRIGIARPTSSSRPRTPLGTPARDHLPLSHCSVNLRHHRPSASPPAISAAFSQDKRTKYLDVSGYDFCYCRLPIAADETSCRSSLVGLRPRLFASAGTRST